MISPLNISLVGMYLTLEDMSQFNWQRYFSKWHKEKLIDLVPSTKYTILKSS